MQMSNMICLPQNNISCWVRDAYTHRLDQIKQGRAQRDEVISLNALKLQSLLDFLSICIPKR